ncbi:uncharacterized protein ARMOST_14750 [Armillaria ostoyae]|uniref:Uncharacterized protein n=1 Tax=Armillaria ostoyae TaxID=47428 RepID=A0A284RRF3_ARMOS|nr:uncharacterized protein ARMOST_14750 [Armillaria ostoyae]
MTVVRILSALDVYMTSKTFNLPSTLIVDIIQLSQPTAKRCRGRYDSELRTDTYPGCPSYSYTNHGLNHGSLRTSSPASPPDAATHLAKLRPMPSSRVAQVNLALPSRSR